MARLQDTGTGTVLTLDKLVVFLKKLPTVVSPHAIAACCLTPEDYRLAFIKIDDKITADMHETVMDAHPQKDEIEAFLATSK